MSTTTPQQNQNSSTSTTAATPSSSTVAPNSTSSLTSPRSRKQFSLFLAGATFLALSSLTTRRSLVRRYNLTRPTFFQPSNHHTMNFVNGPVEAFEALSIATIHVSSVMMMVTGGLSWAFDIGSLDDLRRKIRGGLGADGTGRNVRDVEEEFEEWMATVLERRRQKEKGGEADETGDLEVQGAKRNERGKPR